MASNLGAQMIATDGDNDVLELCCVNMESSTPSCRVLKLFWSDTQPVTVLGLKQELDFVLAANVLD